MREIENNTDRILSRITECTACLCHNDQMALEVVKICLKNNIKVSEQMSIVSIDNSELAELCEVPLTSVKLPMKNMGKTIANNLIQLIKDDKYNATEKFVPSLVERDSVKK